MSEKVKISWGKRRGWREWIPEINEDRHREREEEKGKKRKR